MIKIKKIIIITLMFLLTISVLSFAKLNSEKTDKDIKLNTSDKLILSKYKVNAPKVSELSCDDTLCSATITDEGINKEIFISRRYCEKVNDDNVTCDKWVDYSLEELLEKRDKKIKIILEKVAEGLKKRDKKTSKALTLQEGTITIT